VTALGVHPDYPTVPYLAAGTNSYGLLISQNDGIDWMWSSAGLPLDTPITHLAFAPGELIALTADGVAYNSRNSGANWVSIPGLGEGVSDITVSPTYADDGILFAVRQGDLLRSTNRGESWTPVLPANGCPLNVAFSPAFSADRVVYAPRCDHLVLSTDAGASWSDVPLDGENLNIGHLMNVQVYQDRITAKLKGCPFTRSMEGEIGV
jgi:photosystem II stability/assembly factor-like uncharacterized protein